MTRVSSDNSQEMEAETTWGGENPSREGAHTRLELTERKVVKQVR